MPNNYKLVSVVVPCFNQADYLHEALDSVFKQTYLNWECIIVNDGSPDNTDEIAAEYCSKDERFRYLVKSNGGLSSARNAGIKYSKGDYILTLDADDRISDCYLQRAVGILSLNPTVKVVACDVQLFGSANQLVEMPIYEFKNLLLENSMHCSFIYRRIDYDLTNGYDESMRDGFEDWDFWIGLLKNGGDVYRIKFPCFFYRKKETSMITQIMESDEKVFDTTLKVYNNHIDSYKKYFDNPIILIKENAKLNTVIENYQNSRTYRWGLKILNWKKKLKL